LFWHGVLSRREYTIIILSCAGAALLVWILLGLPLAGLMAVGGATPQQAAAAAAVVLRTAVLLLMLPPVIGATMKRLRSVGKPLAYMLVFLIPCGGPLLVLALMIGDDPDPKIG
jgi:uncharacterized membrane protein YhaH (DUF805 family)